MHLRTLGLALGIGTLAVSAGAADDHLHCYKIKDPLKLQATVDLDSPQFGVAEGCTVGKAKMFCVPAAKTVISATDKTTGDPIDPLPISGPTPGDHLCYKVRCPEPYPADTEISDQFGNRTLTKFKTSLLCTPAIKGPPPKRVFVTSQEFPATFGSLAAADQACQDAAADASLGGVYKAWLSDGTTSAASRLSHSPAAYKRVDGVTVAANFADLSDGSLAAPINVTELGTNILIGLGVWTGTMINGGSYLGNCNDWTSTAAAEGGVIGIANSVISEWTALLNDSCLNVNRLYCLEQ